MTSIEEVIAFSREFINLRYSRSAERKAKIREAYREATGQILTKSCSTCYIEAIFKIIKSQRKMATSSYEMKQGYVAQFDVAFKGKRAFTNKELTDELAEEYLRRYPSRACYFSRMPSQNAEGYTPPPVGITIIEPTPQPDNPVIVDPVVEMTGAKKATKGKGKAKK